MLVGRVRCGQSPRVQLRRPSAGQNAVAGIVDIILVSTWS